MRTFTTVLLVLAAAALRAHADCDCSREGATISLLRSRADNNDVEINRLFRASDELERRINEISSGPEVDELAARVNALTGSDCPENQFECADRGGCVDPLLVCDHADDCSDHSDESDETCTILTPEGASFSAYVQGNDCFRTAANQVRVVITNAERSDILPSKVSIEASTFLYSLDGSYNIGTASGYFNYGTRTFSVRANDGDIVDLQCTFNSYNENECTGFLSRGVGEEPCATVVFERD